MSEQRLFVQDAVRFIRYYRVAFENCPLQLYSSALVFSPRQSIIRNEFQSQVVNWITKRPVVDKEWSLCLQTLEGHRGDVYILSFSPDGTTLASASSGMI
ncbi:Vegetative incompatibility protein HET-E-1 [Colletotrichum aenigma]|nr:Vegetative incompatibility protein HET-E-1 [Colletotrichum aenigma]KAF5524076.1 Vegetative incompatibility protein HET-E-1 [Colletotrichum aenigma]